MISLDSLSLCLCLRPFWPGRWVLQLVMDAPYRRQLSLHLPKLIIWAVLEAVVGVKTWHWCVQYPHAPTLLCNSIARVGCCASRRGAAGCRATGRAAGVNAAPPPHLPPRPRLLCVQAGKPQRCRSRGARL